MGQQMNIKDFQHCEDGDCTSCSRWKKCVKEYLDYLTELMRKKRLDK